MLTLASDFGSPYPAAMKGVCHRRTDARLVDVAHDLPRGDVRAGAFWLRFVLPEFPPAVHLAVVDPGVGTGRDALVVRAGDHLLVGPDNGLLLPAARALAGDDPAAERAGPGTGTGTGERVVDRDALSLFVVDVDAVAPDSRTFHGRDLFAPVAADVHEAVAGGGGGDGWTPAAAADLDVLAPAAEAVDLRFPTPTTPAPDRATGEVLVVDGFGNAITNLPGDLLGGWSTAVVGDERVPIVDTFAGVSPGDPLVTVGSHGNVELDVNDGRGADHFGLRPGDAVHLRFAE